MHWLVLFHENDLKMRDILRSLRHDAYQMDVEMLAKYNLCKCHPVARPNIRELRFFELDVPEPAAKAFQKKLDSIGFLPFQLNGALRFLLGRAIHFLFPTRDFKIEWSKGNTRRYNNRSMIVATVHDNLPDKDKDTITCRKCKGVYLRDWL